jgi:AraC-like DNA-binding protein
LFGLNENFIFSQGHLNYLDYNLFHSITKTLAGPRDLFIAASLVNLYYVIIVTYLVKTVLKELRRSKKKNKTHIQWLILLNLYVISSALAAVTNSILLLLELDYPVLFLLNIMVITFASVIPMLFPKYAKHITSFKKEVDRSKNAKEKKEYLQIVASLKNSKMFLNPAKNLSHLATTTKISSKVITELIYKFESISFHNFLNKHRIKYAKQKIKEGYLSLYSIEALCIVSGFKSAQPFYIAFKKFEGKTPTEYLNSLK